MVLKDHRELKVLLVCKVRPVFKDRLDSKVDKELKDHKAHKDPKGPKVRLELKDQ